MQPRYRGSGADRGAQAQQPEREAQIREHQTPRMDHERQGIDHHNHRVAVIISSSFSDHLKVAGILGVSRSFGDMELKQWVTAEPHTRTVLLNDKDAFLILACDGVSITRLMSSILINHDPAVGRVHPSEGRGHCLRTCE